MYLNLNMIFRNFVGRVLGSEIKVRLIIHLFSENVPMSEREIARVLGFSHSPINKAFKDFYDANLVSPIKIGKSTLWKLNTKSYAYNILSRENMFAYLARDQPIENLKEKLKGFGSFCAVNKIILYGSVAEGKETPSSDIDIVVFVNSENEKPQIYKALDEKSDECMVEYGNRLHFQVFTNEEFSKKGKNFRDNVEKGIVVFSR